jgi:hypothetical protein
VGAVADGLERPGLGELGQQHPVVGRVGVDVDVHPVPVPFVPQGAGLGPLTTLIVPADPHHALALTGDDAGVRDPRSEPGVVARVRHRVPNLIGGRGDGPLDPQRDR